MIYTIQNAGGEVYGFFEMPPNNQSPEVWAAELGVELADILGINGVVDAPLATRPDPASDYVKVDRVVIDIDPFKASEIPRVHETIGRLASLHSD